MVGEFGSNYCISNLKHIAVTSCLRVLSLIKLVLMVLAFVEAFVVFGSSLLANAILNTQQGFKIQKKATLDKFYHFPSNIKNLVGVCVCSPQSLFQIIV